MAYNYNGKTYNTYADAVAAGMPRYDTPEEAGAYGAANPSTAVPWTTVNGTRMYGGNSPDGAYNPYSQTPSGGSQGSNIQSTNSFIDPYFREMMVSGMTNSGQLPAGLSWGDFFRSDEYYANKESGLYGDIRDTTMAAGDRYLGQTLNEVNRVSQRAGKLGSSYNIGTLTGEGSRFATDTAANLAQSRLDIYGAVNQERGMNLSAGTQLASTSMSAQAQERAAIIQAASNQQIADIQARVDLSAQDKQLQIAQIQAQTQKDVANIQSETSLSLQANEFDFNTQDGIKSWVAANNLTDKTIEYQHSEAVNALAQNMTQFNLSRATDREMFQAQIKQMYAALEVTENRDEWEKQLAFDTLTESTRQYNLTSKDDMRRFNTQIREASKQFNMSLQQEKQLQQSALREQARQFDQGTEYEFQQWSQQFSESVRQFDMSWSDQHDALSTALSIQQEQAKDENLARDIGLVLQVMEDPAITSMLDKAGQKGTSAGTFAAEIMGSVLSAIVTGGLELDEAGIKQLIQKAMSEGTASTATNTNDEQETPSGAYGLG